MSTVRKYVNKINGRSGTYQAQKTCPIGAFDHKEEMMVGARAEYRLQNHV